MVGEMPDARHPQDDSFWLTGATHGDGATVDIHVRGESIVAVEPSGPDRGGGARDLTGYVVLPAPVEPHAHLDKALTADIVTNPKGDLMTAIERWQAHYPELTYDDIGDRARRAAELSLASGATAIRTHVDVSAQAGLDPTRALVDLRAEFEGLCEIQVIGLVAPPITGRAGVENLAVLADALDIGLDGVGGAPPNDADPMTAVEVCVELAAQRDVLLDLHTDETLDPEVLTLPHLAEVARDHDYGSRSVASHCVSLGVQPESTQRSVAEQVAASGVTVIALPQTNLFLQARGQHTSPARGLTAMRPLLDAGVTVAGGGDNVQDPFNTMGRGDPFETAALLVMAGHLTPDESLRAITASARAAMGLAEVSISADSPAELLAVRAATAREAVAEAGPDRLVVHRGRVVAETTATRRIHR